MMKKLNLGSLIEFLLPWAMLLFAIYYSILWFVYQPYLGFYDAKSTVVSLYSNPLQKEESVQIGDVILQVNGITGQQTEQDLTIGYFNNVKPNDILKILVERAGEQKTIQYIVPGVNSTELFDRLNSNWFLPYIFWLAGTATLFFLRPHNQVRLLLALFCYSTTIWLSAGILSGLQLFNSALLLRSAMWVSVPVYLHLHWLFPTPLRKLKPWVWMILYGFSAIMAALSWLQLVPRSFYMVGFVSAIVGSFILLIIHLITQPSERRPLFGLVAALGISLIPVLIIVILEIAGIQYYFSGVVALGLAALPGFYFFTLYQRQFSGELSKKVTRLVWAFLLVILVGLLFSFLLAWGSQFFSQFTYSNLNRLNLVAAVILLIISIVSLTPFLALPALANDKVTFEYGKGRLNFSANRAAAGIFFLLFELILILLLVFLLLQVDFPITSEIGIIMVAFISGATAILGYPLFRRLFERLALGMKLVPEKLMITYSERITTSLDTASLRALLVDEVMPSLLIRQFAQLKIQGEMLQPVYTLRMTPEMLPATGSSAALDAAAKTGVQDHNFAGLPDWVRLVIPLRVANETRGYWLLGQRDPDNRYTDDDVQTLKTLADQTALAVVNIEQAENLQAFYFADIGRNEAERSALAAELHDDVLNQLAVLNTNLPENNPATQEAYEKATTRIRDIINGLRPTMLNYGLRAAFETLADDLNDRLPEGPEILLDIPASEVRFERNIELSLFRIVQQACNNAIQHASCQRIEISGSLAENGIHLSVQDDGKGFAMEGPVTLANLLAGRHFGLVGMYERAALIGADLQVISAPGQGSRIQLTWIKK